MNSLYLALKNNTVSLNGYEIDCRKVLNLIANDKYGVLPAKILKSIRKDLQKDGLLNVEDINEIIDTMTTTQSAQDDKSKTVYRDLTPNDYKKIDLTNIEKCIAHTKDLLKNNVKLYRITNLLKELASEGIIPIDYDYSKIREILIEKGLITIDSIRQTVATDYALENGFYFISSVSNKKEEPTYGYYVSEKLRELLIDVFSSYKNIDELRRIS